MFLIAEPNEKTVERFLESQKDKPFSYAEVGASRSGNPPNGYQVDHNRLQIGRGRAEFDRAIEAARSWKMFDLTWMKLYPKNAPIEVGKTVAVIIKHFGFHSLNAARIVYVLEENHTAAVEKFGFAYGTLAGHSERGEVRFSVEYHKQDETIWYDLFSFSKPNDILAILGYPFSRYLQRRFTNQSKQAMTRAVQR